MGSQNRLRAAGAAGVTPLAQTLLWCVFVVSMMYLCLFIAGGAV